MQERIKEHSEIPNKTETIEDLKERLFKATEIITELAYLNDYIRKEYDPNYVHPGEGYVEKQLNRYWKSLKVKDVFIRK